MKKVILGMGLLLGLAMSMGAAAVHETSLDGSIEPVAVSFDGPPDPICPLPRGCHPRP